MLVSPSQCIYVLIWAVIVKVALTLLRAIRNPLSSLPGPWYTKYTSLVLKYFWVSGERAKYVERLHQQYGSAVRLSPSEVDFCTATAAKIIHSYRGNFIKGEMYSRIVTPDMENVFTTTDTVFHSSQRRLLSAPLSESSLKQFEKAVTARIQLAVQKIGEESRKRGAADVLKWWLFMATDIIGELSFGDSFRMLERGKKNQYAEDLGKVAVLAGMRISFPVAIRVAAYLSLPFLREPAAATDRLVSYARASVQRYHKLLEADPYNAPATLFTKLYRAGEEGMSLREIVAEAQAYIIAGSDTTAITLTYLVWAVCKDNVIRRRLVEELERLPVAYTDEDLKAATYLNMVIQETLRLYSAAPSALPRLVPEGGVEIDGFWIPGRTTVCTQGYSLHRDPEVFRQPEEYESRALYDCANTDFLGSFDPSRWETPSAKMNEMLMPFGGGSRACLGVHLARMELRIATAQFFRAYPQASPSTLDGFCDDEMTQKIYFLMFPKNKRCLVEAA